MLFLFFGATLPIPLKFSYKTAFGGNMGLGVSKRAFAVLFLITVSLNQNVSAQSGHSEIEDFFKIDFRNLQSYEYAQSLLTRLGYEDYVKKIEDQLQRPNEISDVSKLALEKSKKMLNSLNAARNLGAFLFMAINKIKINPAEVTAVQELVAQQLSPFPMIHFEPLPNDQKLNLKHLTTEKALEKKREFAERRARERFLLEKNNLRRLFLALVRGFPSFETNKAQVSQWLEDQIAVAIQDSYIFSNRQQNRFLGQALVLSYVAYARLNHWEKLESALKIKLRNHGLFLENYTHAYYVQDVGKNDLRGHALKSGDVAFEYFHGQESFFTSLVIEPSSRENKEVAETYHLQTSILNVHKFLSTSRFYSTLDKIESYQNLSAQEKNEYNTFWDQDNAKGFSHSGLVKVNSDPQTGLKVAWIWDSYPERDKVGPVRIMSVHGFAYAERMMRLGFLRYSPEKLLQSFKSQIQERGYLKTVWQSYGSFVGETDDGKKIPNQDTEKHYDWPTHIDEDTVRGWTTLNAHQADRWFEQQLLPRVFERLEDFLSGANATLFADGFSNGKNLLYCSQLVVVAFLQAGNIDLQESPDQIWKLITYFSDEIQSALKMSIGQRLVSPNGLIWQKKIFQNLVQFNLTASTTKVQMQQQSPTWAERYTMQLQQVVESVEKSSTEKFEDIKPLDERTLKDYEIAFDVES